MTTSVVRVAYDPDTDVPNLPLDDLVRVHSMCPHCRTDADVFVAFSARESWEHSETEHPETITTTRKD